MIYFGVFSLSIVFALLSDLANRAKLKGFSSVCLFLALLIPSLLAGFRDITVGIDTGAYVQSVFYDAVSSSSFNGFLSYSEPVEILFRGLAYMISGCSNNIFFFLFSIQFIILSNIIIATRLAGKTIPLWLVLFFYFFIFYYQTLNVARQMLAASFLLVAFGFVVRRQVFPFLMFLFLAIGFHSTSVVFAIIYPGFQFLTIRRFSKGQLAVLFLSVLGSIVFLFVSFDQIISFVVNTGVLPLKFLQYQVSSGRYESGVFSISDSIFYSSIIGFSFYSYRKSTLGKKSLFFVVIAMLTLTLNLTSLLVVWANRLYLYFALVLLLLLSASFVNRFPFRKTVLCVFLGLSVLFWFFVVIRNGGAQTYPYTSTLLGI